MSSSATAKLIAELVATTPGAGQDARARHLLSQALHGLVRLARSEQLLEMRRDTARAAGAGSRREMRALLRRMKTQGAREQAQLPLELLAGEADEDA